MRADLDLDWDLVLLRPRSSGLKEVIRLRVFLSAPCDSCDERESIETDRLLRLRKALSSCPRCFGPSCFRGGERDRFVEMVETESADDVDSERPRLRSSSFFFSISSATPLLRTRSSGTSVVSFGFRLGLSSCCVREGRDL
jgi:hypothetical protein